MISKKKDAALGFIFVTLLLDSIGFGIIIPIMPELILLASLYRTLKSEKA